MDRATARMMVDRAMAAGCNYFDTAYMYHNGESEMFAAEALKKYPRDSYCLTTKMPTIMLKQEEDLERIFQEQLRRTQAGYFDFYLMHWLNADHWKIAEKLKLYDFMKKKQAEGKIRRIGFSYHGEPEVLEKIAKAYPWDVAQIQLNYLDWDLCRSREQYEVLTKLGIPVLVMEPLKGGTLAKLTPEAKAIFEKADPEASAASWGLRYVASLPNVLCVLSGMSAPDQMADNLKTFSPFKPLTDAERKTIAEALAAYRKSGAVPCTACRYCAPCPAEPFSRRNFWNTALSHPASTALRLTLSSRRRMSTACAISRTGLESICKSFLALRGSGREHGCHALFELVFRECMDRLRGAVGKILSGASVSMNINEG